MKAYLFGGAENTIRMEHVLRLFLRFWVCLYHFFFLRFSAKILISFVIIYLLYKNSIITRV